MINLREECQGYYKIEAVKKDGSRRLLADWFPNLILDAGLDRMGDNGDYLNWCQIGSASTAPTASQTSLVARVASTNSKQSDISANSGSDPYFARRTIIYRFAQGNAAGVLAEVGVGWASSAGLFSRALILDAMGNPTTITVLPDESLDVTYELRMYVWASTASGSISINGVIHDVTQKTARAASWAIAGPGMNSGLNLAVEAFTGQVSATIAGSPSGVSIGSADISSAAYTPGSLTRALNISAGLSQFNNASGIGALRVVAGWGEWQIGFTPNIMKKSSEILTFQVRHSWGRKL